MENYSDHRWSSAQCSNNHRKKLKYHPISITSYKEELYQNIHKNNFITNENNTIESPEDKKKNIDCYYEKINKFYNTDTGKFTEITEEEELQFLIKVYKCQLCLLMYNMKTHKQHIKNLYISVYNEQKQNEYLYIIPRITKGLNEYFHIWETTLVNNKESKNYQKYFGKELSFIYHGNNIVKKCIDKYMKFVENHLEELNKYKTHFSKINDIQWIDKLCCSLAAHNFFNTNHIDKDLQNTIKQFNLYIWVKENMININPDNYKNFKNEYNFLQKEIENKLEDTKDKLKEKFDKLKEKFDKLKQLFDEVDSLKEKFNNVEDTIRDITILAICNDFANNDKYLNMLKDSINDILNNLTKIIDKIISKINILDISNDIHNTYKIFKNTMRLFIPKKITELFAKKKIRDINTTITTTIKEEIKSYLNRLKKDISTEHLVRISQQTKGECELKCDMEIRHVLRKLYNGTPSAKARQLSHVIVIAEQLLKKKEQNTHTTTGIVGP